MVITAERDGGQLYVIHRATAGEIVCDYMKLIEVARLLRLVWHCPGPSIGGDFGDEIPLTKDSGIYGGGTTAKRRWAARASAARKAPTALPEPIPALSDIALPG